MAFEPTISAGERPQTYTLDRAVTGTGVDTGYVLNIRNEPGSVAGIATGYGLDGPGSNPSRGEIFRTCPD